MERIKKQGAGNEEDLGDGFSSLGWRCLSLGVNLEGDFNGDFHSYGEIWGEIFKEVFEEMLIFSLHALTASAIIPARPQPKP